MPETISLSTGFLDLTLSVYDGHLYLNSLSTPRISWANPLSPSGLFAVHVSDKRFTAHDLVFQGIAMDSSTSGIPKAVAHFSGPGFGVDLQIWTYSGTALVEIWPVIHNLGLEICRISRVDSVLLDIPAGIILDNPSDTRILSLHRSDPIVEMLTFTSDWGKEFEPHRAPLLDRTVLETRQGRSSKGAHPWFALKHPSGELLSGSIAWSGNWIFRFDPVPEGGFQISGGLNDWQFSKDLLPGETMEAPHAILAFGESLNDISHQYARAGRQHWYPTNSLSARLPVEWNHWWSYEDASINEGVFLRNAERAANLGIELCTLDAGWFGPSEANPINDVHQSWFSYRGDWSKVNQSRFPHGIRPLSDAVHNLGMYFGLWCEIEGLGKNAELAQTHPEFVASRDGEPMGYVCMGNPQVQDWAYQVLTQLISNYHCDWIKLDFNIDPGAGCNRTDHGHGIGDGLFEHYQGYYRLLDRLRGNFPDIVLENCSSGGLRIDLGMLRHTHMTFLSDPDWPVHDLQIFWGATSMLAPNACLHWSFSEWRFEKHKEQTFNPLDPKLTRQQLDYYIRIAMLGAMGLSQRLPDLPSWVAVRLEYHIQMFRQDVRRFICLGELSRLTDQPDRNGSRDRWAAFQYSLVKEDQHLLFVFRMPGAELKRAIILTGLHPERLYQVVTLDGKQFGKSTGKALMEDGLIFTELLEEDSEIVKISAKLVDLT